MTSLEKITCGSVKHQSSVQSTPSPISPATKANETNYLDDFTVALQTDNTT